ncbi:MAG TPA: gamma-glutamyltransferase, partial [Bryobacterales bacterium]|nr:gamma-glutamyltransferase [Bryobacterales bacterium]
MLLLLLALAAALPAQKSPNPPFWRTVVMGTNGMVAAEHPLEALAGFEALRHGGNAIDAAVATFYMTTVVEQHQAGIGGDAFILAYLAGPKQVVFINATGPAPRLATREFYAKLGEIPEAGPYSSEVPGAAAGFDVALEKYGTKTYAELLGPAIDAAAKGHPLTYWSASNFVEALQKVSKYPSSVRVLLKNGKPYGPGDLFVQPDLARTLRTITTEGADSFYRGSLARLTAEFYEKQGGLLRLDDLASYHPEETQPISTMYKGYQVYEAA